MCDVGSTRDAVVAPAVAVCPVGILLRLLLHGEELACDSGGLVVEHVGRVPLWGLERVRRLRCGRTGTACGVMCSRAGGLGRRCALDCHR